MLLLLLQLLWFMPLLSIKQNPKRQGYASYIVSSSLILHVFCIQMQLAIYAHNLSHKQARTRQDNSVMVKEDQEEEGEDKVRTLKMYEVVAALVSLNRVAGGWLYRGLQ